MSRAGSVPVRSAIASTHSSNSSLEVALRISGLSNSFRISTSSARVGTRFSSLCDVVEVFLQCLHHGFGDRRPQRLVGRTLPQRGDAAPHALGLAIRERLVLAREVIAERAQRNARQAGDRLTGDVVDAALEHQLQCGVAERPAGVELLALAKPQRGDHATRLAKSCPVGKIAWQACSNVRTVGVCCVRRRSRRSVCVRLRCVWRGFRLGCVGVWAS